MAEKKPTHVNSRAEELFVQLFCEAFGPDKASNLQIQYPCVDIYGRHRSIDFALDMPDAKIAIEIDGETYHNPDKVSENKYADDLLKQNSLVYDNWKVYRWVYNQLAKQPERVKDELITFLGEYPVFKQFEPSMPTQLGQTIELRDYQQEAVQSLQAMREQGKSIAMLYHATGVGKTITAASDAKSVGGRTLFLVNALKLATQAKETFAKVWPEATLGEYTGQGKSVDTTVVFATVQSLSKNLSDFNSDTFDYIVVDEYEIIGLNLKSQLNQGFRGLVLFLLTLKIADKAIHRRQYAQNRNLSAERGAASLCSASTRHTLPTYISFRRSTELSACVDLHRVPLRHSTHVPVARAA